MTIGVLDQGRAAEAPDAVHFLLRSLDRERLLSELLPASIRRAQDVQGEAWHRAGAAPSHLPGPGALVPVAARLCHPPSATSRVLRHRSLPALAALLPRHAA